MNTTSKALSALAVAGMIAGLGVTSTVSAEPGILAKGKSSVVANEESCSGKDSCNGGDSCSGEDSCNGEDSCSATDK